MKKIDLLRFFTLLSLLVIFTINGCSSDKSPYIDEAEKITAYLKNTNHTIRKMQNRVNLEQNVNASNFFIFSSISVRNSTQATVMFSFLDSISQTYLMISVPISKVRIKFSNDSIPSIKFVFMQSRLYQFFLLKYGRDIYTTTFEGRSGYISPNEVFIKTPQNIFNEYLSYMIINCRESDWPSNIELPLSNAE